MEHKTIFKFKNHTFFINITRSFFVYN